MKPYEYRDEKDEMSGPGLFSGEEGRVVINSEPGEQPGDNDHKTEKPQED
jgi:hypothetical protein